MADTVAVRTLIDDTAHIGVYLTAISDGTGEAAVSKLTLAGVHKVDAGTGGYIVPTALDLMYIEWVVSTFTQVSLFWKATTSDLIIKMLPGYGKLDMTGRGVLSSSMRTQGAQDPLSSGHTGDITLTSSATTNGFYGITAFFKKRTV